MRWLTTKDFKCSNVVANHFRNGINMVKTCRDVYEWSTITLISNQNTIIMASQGILIHPCIVMEINFTWCRFFHIFNITLLASYLVGVNVFHEEWLTPIITLFNHYQPFSFNDSASPSFIKLNMLIRENKHGIVLNSIWLIPNTT